MGLATAKNKTGEKLLSKEVCITTIEQTMTAIHKEYNIDRSRYLDDPREREFFDPILVVGGSINNDNNDKINCLFIAHPDGMVENVVDYASIGSGAAYAEFLLKDLHYDSMSTKEAISIAIHTINEVKSIDPNCGGDTRVACVNNTSVEELGNAQITELSKKISPMLDMIRKKLVPKVIRGELDEKKLREITD